MFKRLFLSIILFNMHVVLAMDEYLRKRLNLHEEVTKKSAKTEYFLAPKNPFHAALGLLSLTFLTTTGGIIYRAHFILKDWTWRHQRNTLYSLGLSLSFGMYYLSLCLKKSTQTTK